VTGGEVIGIGLGLWYGVLLAGPGRAFWFQYHSSRSSGKHSGEAETNEYFKLLKECT
jgi:hypothetical protein